MLNANESLDQLIQQLTSIEHSIKTLQGNSATKEILNIDEVAELLGKSVDTIHRYTHKKTIPHYKPAGTLMFRRSEIMEWIISFKVKTLDEQKEDADASLLAMNKRRA